VTPGTAAAGGATALTEVVAAMSFALDMTEGQPEGHAVRSCAIGLRIAEGVGLDAGRRTSLFHALLLKDAGCSTNASKVAELYGGDDHDVKHRRRLLDQHRPAELAAHLATAAAPGRSPFVKAGRLAALARHGAEGSRRLTELRCERGAEVARMVDAGEEAAQAIRALDEHWDGSGHPSGLVGDEIPLLGRIMCLAQTVEVFHAAGDASFACAMARSRAGTWFDPALVDALSFFEEDDPFWDRLASESDARVLLPAAHEAPAPPEAGEARLDRIAEAFAQIIDAKSPFTFRHSEGVAELAVGTAARLGHGPEALRQLRRAALLHDVGKLGVSNRILDKPGKLDAAEWASMRGHTDATYRILSRVRAFQPFAAIAAAHHERLDGKGYHRGLTAAELPLDARILAVADVCEALTAERPYRGPLPLEKVLAIMGEDVGTAFDADCFAALQGHLGVA
jgi:putative nucleotidyltransferase with HDIG domain